MDSDDFSLIDIGHEDDTLLRNLPPDAAGGFTCSPFVLSGSAAASSRSRPPKTTMTRDKVCFGVTGCIMPDSDKENLKVSCNMKPGSSNLSLEPQRMKRGRKTGSCNLRKSLAWDKAFFTEEGVLSSLELSMISGTPCKHDGKDFSVICEEPRTPMHSRINPANFKTTESKALRKLSSSSTRENKRIGEGSILKQKSHTSVSVKSKKLASANSSGQKDRNGLHNPPLPTSHKRLLSSSPAKPAAQNSKIPRVPVLKPAGHLISTTANNSDASHSKRNRIVPPVDSTPSVQKHLGQKGCFNTRSNTNAPKIVSQRIPKPSKSSDQRTRKNRTDSSSPEKSSTNHQASNVKQSSSSEVISGKIFPVVLKANDGPSKVALSVHANSGSTCIIGQPVQYQAAKPSGLRMPSPSLKFFSEPKISMSNSLGQRNMQPSNLPNSRIPISHSLGATCSDIQSKIPKASMDRIHDSGPSQPCSSLSVSHNLASKWNVIQSKIPKTTMDRVPDSGLVSSINSPKIHDSVQCKNNELVVGAKTHFSEKPLEQTSNNSLVEVDKPFLEHEHTSLSIEGADRIDNRSVSPIRECKFNDTNLFQSSGEQSISPGMGKVSDFHFKQGQYDMPVMTKAHGPDSEVEEYAIIQTPLENDCSVEMPSRISCNKEVQEVQCPSHVTDQVPQCYDGLCSNIEEQLKRNFSSERAFQNDAAHNIMQENKVDKLLAVRGALSTSLEKIVDTANSQQELPLLQCPLRLMDKPVQCADQNPAEDDAFRIVTDEDKMSDALPLDSTLSTFLDTMPQGVEDHVDPSVSECSNDTYGVCQNAHFEPQISPWACKSIPQVDSVICDAGFSFSKVQGLDSRVAKLSIDGIDQQPNNFDELVMETLIPDEATLASLKNKHCSQDLVTPEDSKLRHEEELQFSPSTTSAEPLISDQVASGSLENLHSEDLVSDRELSFQAEFQLNPSTCEDQTIQDAVAVYTHEGPSLVNETVRVSLGKDMCEKDLVLKDGRELIDCSYMEMLLLQNKNENQTANSSAINNTEGYSPHSSRYVCLPLTASSYHSIGVDELETDSQNQEPQNPSLEIQEAENHIILTNSSREDRSSDQTFLKELQLSPRTSEDCTRSSVVVCDIKGSSSPCKIKSPTVRNASTDETDEQFESANQHEVFHDTDNEDAKIRPKILKDGKNLPQLVLRPLSDVTPFSDEWLAAIEAAGEELLTLKTGPVQNSPPAKLSPEPGPWSPVKRKNNQGIGPYDCTKYTGCQQ